jgi:hypothetical protein
LATTARRPPRELGLRRAGCTVRQTRRRASSVCARRWFRRAHTAMEAGGVMSSPRRCQWRAAELSDGWTCARGRGRGLVYILAGGRLGASGVIPTIGARAMWAAMPGDVRSPRRPMVRGWRHTGECGLATWCPPSGCGRHTQKHAGIVQ